MSTWSYTLNDEHKLQTSRNQRAQEDVCI